ncbi:subtilisin family serine protease [Sphingomonas naasensis]|uniref:OmpA-like domain-containing protein n=1 Tax=Sphingomonas naasensis TaxID=1344951 RepID=A0A4S1WSB0_9SPHN|nr:S8 family serine peptidase [Sphingomonas naasensis]NIJ18685.1 subtilisin family serine protease [Sphingomonas naasensis]TGX45923.1 hypothetical protein E5A74_01750 [Sphingomonas naasensis]
MDPGLQELIAGGGPDEEVSVIVRLHPGAPPPPELRLVARFGEIATGRAARGALAAIHAHPSVASLKAPRVYAGEACGCGARNPFADRPPPGEPGLSEADPAPVDSDTRRPDGLAETGRGVVVAVIDWGIDFAHPDFRNPDGGTRLIGLWDQRADGVPAPYGYGRIHRRGEIDRALRSADPFAALGYRPSEAPQPSHGTHVLGIAAGNGRAGGPQGVAPEADLIFVHLGPGVGDLGNSIDLLEAIDFVIRTADGRPVALNMSIGRHAGPHDGTLLVERAIDWLIVNRPGTVVVQSTGNYYARNVHMEGRLREGHAERLPFELPRSDAHPATVEIWYKGGDRFVARAVAPDGGAVTAALGANAVVRDRDGAELARLYHRGADPNNGDNLIALVLRPMAPAGRWAIEIRGVDVADGRWHAWIERNAGCPACQAVFAPGVASPLATTGSICNAMRTIAVGAYDAHDPDQPMARFSSTGPTRDGRRKPLLVAPGVRILSVRSRQSALEPPGYVRMSGTSMAAPHVTGTVALMLEAAGAQPVAAIRNALFASLTAPPAPLADEIERWGYGILDIAAAVAAARRLRDGPVVPARAPRQVQEMAVMESDESETPETASVGPPVTDDERRWTKGRRHSLPTPEQRVLAQFSEAELREMLDLPPRPPVAVSQRESGEADAPTAEPVAPASTPAAAPEPPMPEPSTYDVTPGFEPAPEPASAPAAAPEPPMPPMPLAPPVDPKALLNVAVNPQAPSTQIVGFPGTRLVAPLLAGDVILRGTRKRRARMVTRPGMHRANTIKRRAGRPREGGFYAEVIGEDGYERIAGPDGLLLPDVLIVRSRDGAGLGETDPPVVPRPTIRQGSRGPAVTEAQTRLNTVHAGRVASGAPGLDRCPLATDGVFGANTRAATVAFQRTAFPGQPGEWDGVIGPRSWAALIAASGSGVSQITLPTRCPGLPREQVIDHFEFGSAEVLPRHQPQIIGIARCIMESQSTATPVRHLRLIGHTDPVGSAGENLALGTRRAEAIRREILAAIARMTGRPAPASLVIDVESRGETEPLADAAESRRVQVLSDFAFVVPVPPRPRPATAATVEFVLDDDGDHRVDGSSPVATALMFGLWDNAYDAARAVRNDAAEASNFVGADRRRFYIRVTDRGATGSTVTARWRTLTAGGGDDDAPASQNVTLTETAAGSKVFVSRALMLVTDDTDADQPTHSGLTAGPDAGVRNRGQSNHRLRRADLTGSVRADYTAAAGGTVSVTLPVFRRTPDRRRRITLRVVRLGLTMTPARQAQIDDQFLHANRRWAQTGLRIDAGAAVDLALPAGARDAAGNYIGFLDTPEERLVLDLLLPTTPDNTVTVCFCTLPRPRSDGRRTFNAYAGVTQTQEALLGGRFFIFQHIDLNADLETLAHELHHVLFNRFDSAQALQFFTFNTFAPSGPLPNVSTYRRIQTLFTPDPDNDAANANTFNWMRRVRTTRLPTPPDDPAIGAADTTTGNTSVGTF